MSFIEWQLYPKNIPCNKNLRSIIGIFEQKINSIDSSNHQLASNDVLLVISSDLESLGYKVEKSKLKDDKITVPVLYGRNGRLEKWFDADAYNYDEKTVDSGARSGNAAPLCAGRTSQNGDRIPALGGLQDAAAAIRAADPR